MIGRNKFAITNRRNFDINFRVFDVVRRFLVFSFAFPFRLFFLVTTIRGEYLYSALPFLDKSSISLDNYILRVKISKAFNNSSKYVGITCLRSVIKMKKIEKLEKKEQERTLQKIVSHNCGILIWKFRGAAFELRVNSEEKKGNEPAIFQIFHKNPF